MAIDSVFPVVPLCSGSRRLSAPVHPARVVLSMLMGLAFALPAVPALAQSPVPLPNTISTVAGGATASGGSVTGGVLPVKGAACSAGSPYTATDALGDGCPGLNTVFSGDFRGGLQVDGQGNVFVLDSSNSLVRKIDARSGLVTAVTGTATTGCTSSSDAYGDGCPLAMTHISTARGINIDPYGNVFIAGYGMQTINILCNAVSPLCPNTASHKQVGSMYRIAGCVGSATSTGTSGSGSTNGTSGDGYVASPYGDLSGDVADWGAGSTAYGSCTAAATLGAVASPRGVAADKYGNVFIAETGASGNGFRYRVVVGPASFTLPNGTVQNNPMAAIIALDPAYTGLTAAAAYGKIYPLLGGFTSAATGVTPPTAIGTACAGPSGGSTLDRFGDGCPFYETTSGSGQQGVGADADGNIIFADNSESIVRVLYVGGASMANAIRAANANPTLTVMQGYVYPIIGAINSGATNSTLSATPSLGTTTTIGNGTSKVAIGPYGNIYISDFNQADVLFFDIRTGFVRKLAASGTVCSAKLDSVGDGCPVNNSIFGGQAAGMGIGLNPEGDLYIADNTNALIRKVTASNLIPVTVGSSLTQTEVLHATAGTTSVTAALASPSPDITVGAVSCPAANPDGTLDCTVPVTFAPLTAGQRSGVLQLAAAGVTGNGTFPVAGAASGSTLVADSASPTLTSTGTVSSPVSLAVDGSGDLFTLNTGTGKVVEISSGTSTPIAGSTLPASPYQIAVDNMGNIYATGTGSSSITRLSPTGSGTYTQGSVSYAPLTLPAAPYGIAADPQGNLFVADHTSQAVYEIPVGSNFGSLNPLVTVATGFTGVGELAIDGGGNLFIADPGAGTVKRLLAGAAAPTVFASGINPTHIAADTAGNLYVQDASAKTVTEYPLSGPPTTVYSFTGSASGIAVDSSGLLYEAESGLTAINAIQRQNASFDFGTSITAVFNGTLTNVGNQASTSVNQTDNADFQVVAGSSNGCNIAAPQAIGAACTVSATFTPQSGSGPVSDIVTLLPSSSTSGKLTLNGTKNGTAVTTMTTIGNETPSSPVYVASGTEVSFTVTVAASAGTASGSVAVTVDTSAAVNYNLNASGQAVVPLSGLSAGNHTISATYATQNGFTGSASASTAFSIAQAATALSWTPAAATQQFSSAIGASVLDATATAGGVPVPGFVIYTATPSGGTPSPIHSASFLAIGTYSLGATFVPNDAVNFSGATATIPSYTVTRASTSAPVGATQMLVAADGSGNFSNVQAAVNALPATGGSVYIKPGTYTGDITVVQPNVALRGLGGDPTRVLLTHSAGAFSNSGGVYQYAGEFTSAISNGAQLPSGSSLFSGDEGSATLVVAKGVNAAASSATLIPNSFYGENFTLANTYDTDTATTTTTYVSGGVCTANAGPAQTYNYLFNNSLECASQALAIWITSDLAVMNNVYTTSLQDTIYAGSQGAGSNGYVPSRQYWFRGKVTGTVDYIFGDAAAVFDYSSIYTVPHGTGVNGTATIEAQNKMSQTGSSNDYLSGYIMNSNVFTSQQTGMNGLEFGRPYGPYSTWIMLNSYVDQVAPAGYIEFSNDTNLPTSTYAEYNEIPYTDPATGSADLNGVNYIGQSGSTGQGVAGPRETTSQDPGTLEASNAVKTSLTQAQAQQYFPANFLGTTVPGTVSTTANWNPNTAIASQVNAFVPSGTSATVVGNTSVTILMRPQTPGLGAVTNGTYTIPTGTYTLTDTFNNTTSTLATGSLDSAGEAFYTSSTLAPGTHSLSWTYSGDTNFAGSTTASAYSLTVSPVVTTTTVGSSTNPITYGQSANLTVSVTPAGGSTPATGSVTLTIDGSATQTGMLSDGSASFTVTGLAAGMHSFTATYAGTSSFASSGASSAFSLTVNKAVLTVIGICANRVFDTPNACGALVSGYQYNDGSSTVFTSTPMAASTALRNSPAGQYTAAPVNSTLALTSFGGTNYTVTSSSTTFTVSGGVPQSIFFAPLPNFAHGGSYQLTARTSSGLPVTYTVTAGGASISGSTLTVTSAGTVTVQASQTTDPNGDYAAATSVSRTFTAQ